MRLSFEAVGLMYILAALVGSFPFWLPLWQETAVVGVHRDHAGSLSPLLLLYRKKKEILLANWHNNRTYRPPDLTVTHGVAS